MTEENKRDPGFFSEYTHSPAICQVPPGADTEVAEDRNIKIPAYRIWELGIFKMEAQGKPLEYGKETIKHSISTSFAHTVGKILKNFASV